MTNQDQMRVAFDAWSRKWCDGVLNSDDDAGRVSRLGAWAAWQAATAAAMSMKPESIDTSAERVDVGEPVAKVRIHMTGGNAGLAWSAVPVNDYDSLPLMRGDELLFTADQLAAAVAAERERCARACEDMAAAMAMTYTAPSAGIAALRDCADAIRGGK